MQSSLPFTRSYFKKLRVGIFALLRFFAGAIFLFSVIAHEVVWENEEAVDLSLFRFLSANVIGSRLADFMIVVTYFASAFFEVIQLPMLLSL